MWLLAPASLWPRDRDPNPSKKGWIAIAGVVALGLAGATVLALRRRGLPPQLPGEPTTGQIPAGHINNYVGAPGYVWPHKDRFPNQQAIGLALQNLGYDSGVNAAGWTILSAKAMSAVKGFQRDYNIVRQTDWDFIPVGTQSVGPPDGLVGDKTIEALINAQAWILAANLSWADLLDVGKGSAQIS
jgi:peptidoglycan hydrolase-like protein with peptidoglycan-binding domain